MARRLLLSAVFLLAAWPARARAAEPSEHNYQTWFAAFSHGSLYKNLWFWGDGHVRLYENFQPSAILVRPGLSWRAAPTFYLTAGYAWTPSWQRPNDELRFTDEHRAWQQLLWTPSDPEAGVAAMFRGRLEQRFRPADGDDTGLRFRALWRGQVPLSRDGRVILAIWDELFIGMNDTDWGQRTGVDQNRVFGGVGWKAKPKVLRIEVGYTNVWLVRPGPDPVNHILAINTFWGWPAR